MIEEFCAVRRGPFIGTRLIDGVIVLNEETRIHNSNFFDIKDRDVISIQTKQNRLGMYLMGQAFFSADLLETFKPKSIKRVLICGMNDEILHPICEKYNIEVVVIPNVDISTELG